MEVTQQAVQLGEETLFYLLLVTTKDLFHSLRSKALLFQLKALRALHGFYGAHSRFQVQDTIYNPCRTQGFLQAEFYIYSKAS